MFPLFRKKVLSVLALFVWVGDIVRATIYRTIRALKNDTISCLLGTKIVRQIIFEEQNIRETF